MGSVEETSKAIAASQSKPFARRGSTSKKRNAAQGKILDFPLTKGKVLDGVQFTAFPEYRAISLNFRDKTSLDFVIDTYFTLKADYFDWKTGRQIKRKGWRPIHISGSRRVKS